MSATDPHGAGPHRAEPTQPIEVVATPGDSTAPQAPQAPQGQPATARPPGAPVAPPTPGTNALAILSMVSAILGLTLLPFVGSIIGVVTGHVARGQIRRSGEQGLGPATVGLAIGYVGVALVVIAVVVAVLALLVWAPAQAAA